jgi:CO/xanthine dehydrogenase Mo-binding subunit/RimJ/RimL family protein N-acetyltransferase
MLFDRYPVLEDETILIHKMSESDAGDLHDLATDPEVYKTLPTFLFEQKYPDALEVIRRLDRECFEKKDSIIMGVYLKTDPQRLIGIAELYNYEEEKQKASIGYRLNSKYWGKGLGTRIAALLKGYLMDRGDIKTITAHVMKSNTASATVLSKNGFLAKSQDVLEDLDYREKLMTDKYLFKKTWMYDTVGKSENRLDAPDKVTGRAIYTADIRMDGVLEVSLVRSPVAHAVLKGIKAPAIPEGCYLFTARDLKQNFIPSIFSEQPVLAYDRIRYQGEAVAIVAAPTKQVADELASKVELDLEVLRTVDAIEDALDEGFPKLFENGNICSSFHSDKGDVDSAFKGCDLVLEGSFETPVQIHGFMEPEAAFCHIDDDGRLSLISSTQNAYADLYTVATATGRDPATITSRAATVGGAFGGKDGNTAQVYAAVVTHLTGQPARFVYSREENLRWGMKRHSSKTHAKVGFSKDGHIIAADCSMLLDGGAYALLGPSVLRLGLEHFTGAYSVPNVRLDGKLLYTNHAPASAMRGFGAPQAAFAFENLLNRAAAQLGISQLAIRKINAIHKGQKGPMGGENEHEIALSEALDKFSQSDFYREMTENPEKGCGYSIAVGMMSSGLGKHIPDTCHVTIDRNGDAYTVRTSLVDIGQGSQTVLAQIAAEALGVDIRCIDMQMGQTDNNADSGSTAASRSTFVCGNAILRAAAAIRKGADHAEESYSFPEASGEAIHTYFAFMVQGAKVRINPVSGAVEVLWMHSTTDTGQVINPTVFYGQVFGGVAMSLGMTLSEQIRYRDGISAENSLANYIMPTAMDVPRLTGDYKVKLEPTGPFGAKGMAELPTVAVAPAISSAVCSLVPGLELNRLPIDRMEILKARSNG